MPKRTYSMTVDILVTVSEGEDPWDKLSDWFSECVRQVLNEDIFVDEIITGDYEEEGDHDGTSA